MSFLSAMNISASGMTAQKYRMDIISENIANADTSMTESGGPYRRKMVVFEAYGDSFAARLNKSAQGESAPAGVRVAQVAEDQRPFKAVYDPDHPHADENGYVMLPNVDMLKEVVDAMSASRSYEANITAFNATKLLVTKALEIGR